jgi:hypothetical protein
MFCVKYISFAHPVVSMVSEQEELSCCFSSKNKAAAPQLLRHGCNSKQIVTLPVVHFAAEDIREE